MAARKKVSKKQVKKESKARRLMEVRGNYRVVRSGTNDELKDITYPYMVERYSEKRGLWFYKKSFLTKEDAMKYMARKNKKGEK